MVNKYIGRRSCYAKRENVYVPDLDGVSTDVAPSILALILRDIMRGYTYDDNCNLIPIQPEYGVARAKYLIALAKKHSGALESERVRELVDRVLSEGYIPPEYTVILAGPRAREVARELVRSGIVRERQVRVQEPQRVAVHA